MRKLIVSNLISLDGYAAGPGGDVMALPFDTTFSDYNLELMEAADILVSGATTYRGFVSYWPPVADDPAQPQGEGGALVALGSLRTWNGLLAAGLVDELHMMIGAGVLVDGVPAFSVRPPGPMRLTGARQLGDSNIALLLYSLG